MRFSRQVYWTELPFPPPGDLPDPGINLESLESPAPSGRYLGTFPLCHAMILKSRGCSPTSSHLYIQEFTFNLFSAEYSLNEVKKKKQPHGVLEGKIELGGGPMGLNC